MSAALAMLAAALVIAVFATTTLVVLTIGLVVALNAWLGDPGGTFAVAAFYALVMLVGAWVLSRVARSHRAEAADALEHAADDVDAVARFPQRANS